MEGLKGRQLGRKLDSHPPTFFSVKNLMGGGYISSVDFEISLLGGLRVR